MVLDPAESAIYHKNSLHDLDTHSPRVDHLSIQGQTRCFAWRDFPLPQTLVDLRENCVTVPWSTWRKMSQAARCFPVPTWTALSTPSARLNRIRTKEGTALWCLLCPSKWAFLGNKMRRKPLRGNTSNELSWREEVDEGTLACGLDTARIATRAAHCRLGTLWRLGLCCSPLEPELHVALPYVVFVHFVVLLGGGGWERHLFAPSFAHPSSTALARGLRVVLRPVSW